MSQPCFDIVCLGRNGLDLYSNDIGAAFPDIKTFSAYVGGSPSNIAVGTKRLGLRSAMVTAVGPDPVGEFVVEFFRREGVDTASIPQKPGTRTAAVILGIEPPDRFPMVYYRDNCADVELSIDDVLASPVADTRTLLIAGTNLAREPCRSATIFAAERAKAAGARVVLVLDLRADQWHDLRAYGVNMRTLLPLTNVVIGTASEVKAAMLVEGMEVAVEGSQVSEAKVSGDLEEGIERILASGVEALALTRGADGAAVHVAGGQVFEAAPYPVEIYNTIGAGDAFASGLLYGMRKGWDWQKSARMGAACGAIVVTRHGCANFMPTEAEALAFVEERGGF
ncbi:MAG: 5-dehydro-2-deoxygluconokinase [Bryobacterales bacterium]|nr:5-dehydro-2-deoxygluconokinase [Bryobacterales bacterium]